MGRLFGTDGVRGIANKDLTNELAMKIGMAAAEILMKNKDEDNKPKVMIGKDTRASGDMLEAALTSGFCAVGVDVISVGIVMKPKKKLKLLFLIMRRKPNLKSAAR